MEKVAFPVLLATYVYG